MEPPPFWMMYIEKGRVLAIILLALNAVILTIVLACAGHMMGKSVTGDDSGDESSADDEVDIFLLLFVIPSGMMAVAALVTGLHHVRKWNAATGAAAQGAAWISFMLVLLAMCQASKEFSIKDRSYTPEVFILRVTVIILAPTHLLYNLALYYPDDSRRNLDPPEAD